MPKLNFIPHTQESLTSMAAALEQYAGDLRGTAEAMKSVGFASLQIPNNDQRRRGLVFIESFANGAKAALREAREERGDFGKLESSNGTKKKAVK